MPIDDVVLNSERRGSGQRVVLVHGYTQSGRSWQRVAERLAQQFEVVTVDLPDHGGKQSPHASSLEEAAALLGATGGRASYVGYSLGGRVALTLALEAPELVESLVLIGATPGISDEVARADRRRADEALAARLDPSTGTGLTLEDFLDEWLAGPLFAHLTAEQADRESRLVNDARGLAASLRSTGTGTQIPSHERVAVLAMPILLLAGALDTRFAAIAREMAESIGPNASTALIEEAGHAAPFEQPERFLELVIEFLDRH